MMPLIAGIDAESPMSRYPSGSSNGEEPSEVTAIVAPGSAAAAQAEAGPAGSCRTTSTAKVPASSSSSVIV